MNLLKFFHAAEPSGGRALQAFNPLASSTRQGFLTRSSLGRDAGSRILHSETKSDKFNRLLMDRVQRDMHTTCEHHRQVQAAITRSGITSGQALRDNRKQTSGSLLQTSARSFATKKSSSKKKDVPAWKSAAKQTEKTTAAAEAAKMKTEEVPNTSAAEAGQAEPTAEKLNTA